MEAGAFSLAGKVALVTGGNSGIGLLMIDQEMSSGRLPGMPVEGGTEAT